MKQAFLSENLPLYQGTILVGPKLLEIFSGLAPEGSFTGLMQTLKAVYGSVICGPQQSSPAGTEQPVARHVSAG
jgi:hypothetical protein